MKWLYAYAAMHRGIAVMPAIMGEVRALQDDGKEGHNPGFVLLNTGYACYLPTLSW